MRKEIILAATKADLEQIKQIKSIVQAQIDELRANPKQTYNVGSQVYSWNRYEMILRQTIEWCNQQIAVIGTVFDG